MTPEQFHSEWMARLKARKRQRLMARVRKYWSSALVMAFGLICMAFILFQGYRLVTDDYQRPELNGPTCVDGGGPQPDCIGGFYP